MKITKWTHACVRIEHEGRVLAQADRGDHLRGGGSAPDGFLIHDAQLNDRGLASVNGWFGETVSGHRHLTA
jgi:hypothetical protein